MTKRYLVLLCSTLWFVLGVFSQNRTTEPAADKIVLTNVTIVDMCSENPRIGNILIEGKKIVSIDYNSNTEYKDCEVIDLTGKFIIPGLIDAHTHIATMTFDKREERNAYTQQLLRQMIEGGVTSIRDMAGDARLLAEFKRASALQEIAAPNIYYAAFMAGPDYYEGNDREGRSVAGWPDQYAPWLQCVTDETNLTEAVAQAKGCGASGLKLYASLDAELVKKITDEGKRQGIGVWSHACVMSAKPSDAVEAGVEVISHAEMLKWEQCESLSTKMFDNYGKYYGKMKFDFPELEEVFNQMTEKKIILDATCYHGTVNGMEEAAIFTKKAHAMGVKVAAGTDYFTDPDKKKLPFIHEEMQTLVEHCDFTPYEALRSATIIAAETFKKHAEIGTIETGKMADLLILDANPLTNIKNTTKIAFVIKEGVIYKK